MSIPFIDLKAQYARLKDDIDRRIHTVLDHGGFIMGPEVGELEKALAAFAGAAHCITCANGTDALTIALMAKGVGPGDAVFCPSFTFTATAEAVLLLGASPVFVDVDEDSFNIDLADLERRIAAVRAEGKLRPAAIMPVDLFGRPADYPAINAIAAREGLWVLADAAQGFGGSLNGKRVGSLADITSTSFFPAKPLGCYGDGGAVFTDDAGLAKVMESIRVHGKGGDKYDIIRVGLNSRLDTIQAAVLLVKLAAFPAELEARERVAQAYDRAFADLPGVIVPARMPGATSAWAQYTLRLTNGKRDQVAAALKAQGVPSAVYYPRPMHLQTAYVGLGGGAGSLPVSERLSAEVLSLPMHPDLDEATTDKICSALRGAIAG